MGLGYAIALIAVLAIVFTAGGFYLRYRIYRDLNAAAREGDLDWFFSKIDGFAARFALSVFARERLRFIALARRGDKDQMVEAFNGLMGLKLNDAQRSMVLADGFDGFAANGDRKHCHRILIEMPQAGMTEQQVKTYRCHFDIAVCHNGQMYRTELENKYATLSGRRRGYAAYLLSQIYSETNRKRSRDYREEASRLLGIPADQLTRRIHVNTTV